MNKTGNEMIVTAHGVGLGHSVPLAVQLIQEEMVEGAPTSLIHFGYVANFQ